MRPDTDELTAKKSRNSQSSSGPDLTAVQLTVLAAARTLFEERGYQATTVGDIVHRSGVSVGSIYHWFGGKPDVFIAVVKQTLARHSLSSEQAIRTARAAGETRQYPLFVSGAKAFLLDTWNQRAINRIVLSGDVPGRFNSFSDNVQLVLRQGLLPLKFGDPPLPECNAFAVSGILRAAAMQLMEIEDLATARSLIDYFATLLCRLIGVNAPEAPES